MPTYTCLAHPATFDDESSHALARRITALHAAATGAPPSFAQVIVTELPPGRHFVGGEPADGRSVFVLGHVRAGRSAEVKEELVLGIRDAVVEVARVPADEVWVYLVELPPGQMVEFGHVLPPPGGEAQWLAALPDGLRARLQ